MLYIVDWIPNDANKQFYKSTNKLLMSSLLFLWKPMSSTPTETRRWGRGRGGEEEGGGTPILDMT